MAKIILEPGQTVEDASGYEYIPSETAAIIFLVLFILTALVHVLQGVRGRYWIVFPTLVTGAISMSLFISRTID